MHRSRIGSFASVALGVLLLAGCATADPAPEATASQPPPSEPSPTSSAQPSQPEPSPAPSTIDLDDPSTWLIDGTGIGPIEAGGDFATTLAELPDSWRNDENCLWTAWWNAEDGSYNANFVRGTTAETDPIVLVSVSAADPVAPGAGPRTAEGLGIGSSRAEVLAQYPEAVEGEAQIGEGAWLSVPADEATMFFEFYAPGSDQANAVTVTTLEQPPYEVCG